MSSAINPQWVSMFHDTLSALADIPEREWSAAIARFRQVRIPKDGYFVRPGDKPDKLAFIASGVFRVFFPTEDGDERVMAFREEGRLLSGFSSFLSNRESWFGIQALVDSDILCMDIDQAALSDWTDCWRNVYAKYMEMLFIEKEQREREFLSENAERRYRSFLEKYPALEGRIAQYHIAAYLGITPVALSRIRKTMK